MSKRWMVAVLLTLLSAPAWADKRLDDAVIKADELFRKARVDEAIRTMQKAATQDPQNPEAQLALGRVLMRAGKRDDAGAAFTRAAELASGAAAPMQAQVLGALAGFELLHDSGAKALAHADAAVKAAATAETLATLACAQARAADPAVALATADKAIQLGASVAAAHEARAAALGALGRVGEAVSSARKATDLAPTSASAKVALAFALIADGKAAAAIEVARAATQADPQAAEAFAALGLALGKANPNEWGAAISEAQQGAFLDLKSVVVQYAVGQVFEINNTFDQAIAAYQSAVNVDPGFCPTAAGLVQMTFRTGGVDAALPLAQKLAPTNANCAGVQLVLGEALLRKENSAAALPALQKAAKLLPHSPDANYFLGLAYTLQGQIPEAVEPFGRAVELKPSDLDYRTAFGLALGRAQEQERAVDVLQAVVREPRYKGTDAWINLGYVLRMMGRFPEAIEAYQKAVTLDAKSAPAAYGLALSLVQAKRWDDAVPALRRAMELDPNVRADALVRMARCLIEKVKETKSKDVAAAEAAYNEAAAVAGADNDTLKAIAQNIDVIKKGVPLTASQMEAEAVDVPRWARCVMNPGKCGVADRVRGIAELRKAGSDGLTYITYAVRQDPEAAPRNAGVQALQTMKGVCAQARDLKLIANMECPPPVVSSTAAEARKELEVCDSIRAARTFAQRIVPTCGGR